jgi:hypothetical protein
VPAISPYIIEPIFEQFCALLCPNEKWIIHSAAIGPAYPIRCSSISWCKCWSSAAPTAGSPMSRARLLRSAPQAR